MMSQWGHCIFPRIYTDSLKMNTHSVEFIHIIQLYKYDAYDAYKDKI